MENDNKLIAEFMEYEDHQEMGEYVIAEYHKSWDLLIPVISKIVHEEGGNIILDLEDKKSTHNDVVMFIIKQHIEDDLQDKADAHISQREDFPQ